MIRTVTYVEPATMTNTRTAMYAKPATMAHTVTHMGLIIMTRIALWMMRTAMRRFVKQESIMPDFIVAAGKSIIREKTAKWIVFRKIIKTSLYGRGF